MITTQSQKPEDVKHAQWHEYQLSVPVLVPVQGFFYWLVTRIKKPFIAISSHIRGGLHPARYYHRYGHIPVNSHPDCEKHIVFYCHNIGELRTIIPLVKLAHQQHPRWAFTVLTNTVDPYMTCKGYLPEVSQVYFVPIDIPSLTARAMRRLRPDVLVMVENDLRMHLVAQAKQHGVGTIMLGWEMPGRDSARYGTPQVTHYVLDCLDVFAMRSEADAEIMRQHGVAEERIFVTGNIRFDISALTSNIVDEKLDAFLTTWHTGGPIFTAGSIGVNAEEQLILDSLKKLRLQTPNLRCLLAPRRPDSGPEVQQLAQKNGFVAILRSEIDGYQGPAPDIMVLDTMGELYSVYSRSDMAYIGGALYDQGGHNFIEAALHGIPIMFGPNYAANRELVETLQAHGLSCVIHNGDELTALLATYLADENARKKAGEICRAAVDELSGATARNLQLIEELLASMNNNSSLAIGKSLG